jgi:hypothetical protein
MICDINNSMLAKREMMWTRICNFN